jgi:hypothetical protein
LCERFNGRSLSMTRGPDLDSPQLFLYDGAAGEHGRNTGSVYSDDCFIALVMAVLKRL